MLKKKRLSKLYILPVTGYFVTILAANSSTSYSQQPPVTTSQNQTATYPGTTTNVGTGNNIGNSSTSSNQSAGGTNGSLNISTGSLTPSGNGINTSPATGMSGQPATGMSGQPATGMSSQPATGMSSQPVTGMSSQPATGMSSQPVTGTNGQPALGTNGQPATGVYGQPVTNPGGIPTTGSNGITAEGTPPPLDLNQPAPIQPPMTGVVNPTTPGNDGTGTLSLNNSANSAGPRAREFQGDDIGQVLRLLARQAKINLVVSDAVQGTVNMRLEDVTALRAVEIICQAKNLTFNNIDGVYYVKTLAEKAIEPTQNGSYTFSYARAPQVVGLLTNQLVSKAIPPQVDERTNTIFFQEAKSNVAFIYKFLKEIDLPTRQVMIEARLVEVTNNPVQSYGINWAGVFGNATSPKSFGYGGTNFPTLTQAQIPVTTQTPGQAPVTTLIPQYTKNGAPVQVPTAYDVGFTNGVATPFDLIKNGEYGQLGNAIGGQLAILSIPQFSATMSLLNEDSDAEFLANPRIVTADNLEATIKIIRQQPVPQLNFNDQTATAVFSGFQDKTYGNTLVVKPSINKEDFITLSVKPEISNRVGDQTFTFSGAVVSSPIIDTRSLQANVLIRSGCTLAIGGLLQDESDRIFTKVPILGDIPILGYLFQSHNNTRTKRNLLIFVTPTIIREPYGTGLEDQITGLKNSSFHEYADINGWRNNAKGAVRVIKRRENQLAGQYPIPGNSDCKALNGAQGVSFKESVDSRGN